MSIPTMITTYWSQVALLLLGIGYIIRIVLESRNKKIETAHSLFQQNKIRVINEFFQNYSKVVLMWNSIPFFKIVQQKNNFEFLESETLPFLSELGKSVMLLKLYTSYKDCKDFEIINARMFEVYQELTDIYFSMSEDSMIDQNLKYEKFMKSKVNESDLLLNSLCERIRKDFNS